MENLKINSDLKSNVFDFILDENKISVTLLDAPLNSCIGSISQAIAYKVEDNYHIALYSDQKKLHILYTQDSPKVRTINIVFDRFDELKFQKNKAICKINDLSLTIDVIDGIIINYVDKVLTLSTSSSDMRLEIYQIKEEENFQISNYFSTLVVDSNVFVPLGDRGPEFSIGVFDKIWSHPRPIRFGVPIISTVPAHDGGLTTEEQFYYDTGDGPKKKTMYFRVVCSRELSDNLPVKLLIYLSNGLDTITNPIAVSLTKYESNPSVYSGSFDFYKEDTVNYVDGFVYFSVFVDIIQQVSLPIKADDTSATFTTRNSLEYNKF